MTIEVVGHVLNLRIRGQDLDSRRKILYSRSHRILARRAVVVRHHRQGGHAVFASTAATTTTTAATAATTSAAASSLVARALTALGRRSVAGRNSSDQRSHLSLGFRRQSKRGVDLRNGRHGAASAVVVVVVVVVVAVAVVVVAAAAVAVVTVHDSGGGTAAVISLLFATFVSR